MRGYGSLPLRLTLAVFVAMLYARLLFTNRVLASGDILLYFYPYRDYAAAALRSGEIPLWNPYIFLGVPFLANPQAAVLYPLHWPLSWFPVTTQVYWSAAIHTWLLGMGGYRVAAFVGAKPLGRVDHRAGLGGQRFLWRLDGPSEPNEWRGVAAVGTGGAGVGGSGAVSGRARLRAAGLFAVLVALMLLAGHTQTVYINLFGLGVWMVWPLVTAVLPNCVSKYFPGSCRASRKVVSTENSIHTVRLRMTAQTV